MKNRDRRALLLGGAAVIVAVFVLRLAPASVRTFEALRSRAFQQTNMLQKARETVLAASALGDSLAATLNDLVTLAPKLVGSGTPAQAGAALSAAVTLAAERAGLRVLQLNPLADSVGAVFGTACLHVQLEGDITGLAAFLAQVESGELVLSMDHFVVQTAELLQGPRAPEVLRLEVDIRGLFLVEEDA